MYIHLYICKNMYKMHCIQCACAVCKLTKVQFKHRVFSENFSLNPIHWMWGGQFKVLNIVQRSWTRTFRLTSASLNRSFRPDFNSRMFSPQWFQWKVYGNQFKHFPIQWNIFSETYSRRFEPWKLLFSESYIFVWIAICDQFKHKFSLKSISVKSFHRWKLTFKLT